MLKLFFLQALVVLPCLGNAQPQLKSTAHGLKMMIGAAPKEELIREMRFEHGEDDSINVIRFDHVGPNLYPLIISSRLPVATDSLGILSFRLQKDTLYNFLKMIDHVTPKMNRYLDYVLIRVTYRFEGRMEQYHITNAKIATGFLRLIERKFVANDDPGALEKFYEFIARMKLRKAVHGKWVWIYL